MHHLVSKESGTNVDVLSGERIAHLEQATTAGGPGPGDAAEADADSTSGSAHPAKRFKLCLYSNNLADPGDPSNNHRTGRSPIFS